MHFAGANNAKSPKMSHGKRYQMPCVYPGICVGLLVKKSQNISSCCTVKAPFIKPNWQGLT